MKQFNDSSKEKARKSAIRGKGASDWMQSALQSKFEVIIIIISIELQTHDFHSPTITDTFITIILFGDYLHF